MPCACVGHILRPGNPTARTTHPPRPQMHSRTCPCPSAPSLSHQTPTAHPSFRTSLQPSCSSQLPARTRPLTARRHPDALGHIFFISPLSHPLVAPGEDTLSATTNHETAFAHRVPQCAYHRLPMHQHTPQTWDEWLRRRWKVVDMHTIRYIICPRI